MPVSYLAHDDMWEIRNGEAGDRHGWFVTRVTVRPSASGCAQCRAELCVGRSREQCAPLPADWRCGEDNDALWPVGFSSWNVAKAGGCECAGECLAIEAFGYRVGGGLQWPHSGESARLLGRTVCYFGGGCGFV